MHAPCQTADLALAILNLASIWRRRPRAALGQGPAALGQGPEVDLELCPRVELARRVTSKEANLLL